MIAGAIAGVLCAIAAHGAYILAAIIKLPWGAANLPGVLTISFLISHLSYEIMHYLVFGPIFGAIYALYYDSTPGKGVFKGLVYGLILYLISNLYYGVLLVQRWGYETITDAIGAWWMGFFTLATYGIVLGALYKKPTRAIIKSDTRNGILPGALAGVVGGIAAIIFMITGVILKVWEPVPGILSAMYLTTNHLFEIIVTCAFGAIFGILYSIYYNSTPGKGILKGLVFGLILYLISSVRIGVLLVGYGIYFNRGMVIFWIGFFTWIVYGLVLSLLYRETSKVIKE